MYPISFSYKCKNSAAILDVIWFNNYFTQVTYLVESPQSLAQTIFKPCLMKAWPTFWVAKALVCHG